ncbi:MAG: hypothetical protein EHM88_12235 [Candidatus Rokuibacteriota bacterium]|nr:MAG: hypothetical protein EHM88_12235 [Candidatus Rokubacteria bacterium]
MSKSASAAAARQPASADHAARRRPGPASRRRGSPRGSSRPRVRAPGTRCGCWRGPYPSPRSWSCRPRCRPRRAARC